MLIIDRIEDGIVVIEDGDSRFEVPASMLDGSVKEGDVVTLENGMYVPDISDTEKRRREIQKLQDDLWE